MNALLAGAKDATMASLAKLLRKIRKHDAMLDNLRAFIDVARRGTFSAVADARNVAVSSIARQVDVLEAELAVRLFHRSSRRLLLTDAGEQFLLREQAIVAEFDEAEAALIDVQSEPRGPLSVAVPSSFGRPPRGPRGHNLSTALSAAFTYSQCMGRFTRS